MPLPERKPGERRDDFIPRCIEQVLSKGEAKDRRQAAGICYTIANK